jgi:hypothetical protein
MKQPHPSQQILALAAGGDLPWLEALRVRFHARRCGTCRSHLRGFLEARSALQQGAAGMPPELDWDRISAEMAANIRLGLAAGAIAGGEQSPRSSASSPAMPAWRVAVICASLALVFGSAWLLREPRPLTVQPPVVSGLHLQLPADARILDVDFDGGQRASRMDQDTGQVTLYHVYTD